MIDQRVAGENVIRVSAMGGSNSTAPLTCSVTCWALMAQPVYAIVVKLKFHTTEKKSTTEGVNQEIVQMLLIKFWAEHIAVWIMLTGNVFFPLK